METILAAEGLARGHGLGQEKEIRLIVLNGGIEIVNLAANGAADPVNFARRVHP